MQNKARMERAKLFHSFDALQGFREYLRQKEEITVEKKYLMEDELAILQHKLNHLQHNDMIQVVYYDKNKYIKKQGMFVKLDQIQRRIQVVNQWINICDILDIEVLTHHNFSFDV